MKKMMIVFMALIFLSPSLYCSGILTFKLGFFLPKAESDIWQIEFENMDFTKSHYYSSGFAFTYEYFLTPQLSIALGVDSYNKNKSGTYTEYFGVYGSVFAEIFDFAFPNGLEGDFFSDEMFPIIHSFNVSITPVQASLKLTPMGRRGKFIPYVGGGVGLYIWYVRLLGNMVDFADPWIYGVDTEIYPVYETFAREDSRLTIGYHGFAGVMIPVAQRFTMELEFKYNYAKGNFRTGADASFEGFDPFDLSGYHISLGMNYWF